MGRLKNIRDAKRRVDEVTERMLKVQDNIDRGGPRVTAKEHAELHDKATAADAALRNAIRGRS